MARTLRIAAIVIGAVIGSGIILKGLFPSTSTSTSTEPAATEPAAIEPAATEPPQVAWSSVSFTDEWGEVIGTGARSALTRPKQRPEFPYGDLQATLIVEGCDEAWIRFTKHPNLTGGDIRNGYTSYSLAARAAGQRVKEPMTMRWNDEDLVWSSGAAAAIRGWAREDSYEVLVPLYVGDHVWTFDMSGAQDAIGQVCPADGN